MDTYRIDEYHFKRKEYHGNVRMINNNIADVYMIDHKNNLKYSWRIRYLADLGIWPHKADTIAKFARHHGKHRKYYIQLENEYSYKDFDRKKKG